MARGTSLLKLVDMLRSETNQSNSVSVGVDSLPVLKQTLRRVQESVCDKYDWPFLRVNPSITLNSGQRFYDFPHNPDGSSALDLERVEKVYRYWSGIYVPIDRGIGLRQYSQYSSDNGVRADPVEAWDVRWTGTAEQMEVWPIPVAQGTLVYFLGIRPLRPLVADSDVADMDDYLIVLYAAAELLARQKSIDAQAKLAAANDRFQTLKSRSKGATGMSVMNGGDRSGRPHRGQTIIRIGRN